MSHTIHTHVLRADRANVGEYEELATDGDWYVASMVRSLLATTTTNHRLQRGRLRSEAIPTQPMSEPWWDDQRRFDWGA